jgi:hypothetical protein
LISLQHKKRQNDEDRQFLQLLNRELAEGFPNPDRAGCPDSDLLQRVARHQVPISEIDPWIDHLGSCSQCFAEFHRLKAVSSARRRQRVILCAVAACIAFASVGILLKQLKRGGAGTTPVAATSPTKHAVETGSGSGRQDAPNTGSDKEPFEVSLNLTRSTTRGEKSANGGEMIRVPARLLECRITLPLGSSDGLYYVRVQRADRREVIRMAQGSANINDGDIRLEVELELSNVAAGGYLLSYRRAGESWHSVPIVITNPTN